MQLQTLCDQRKEMNRNHFEDKMQLMLNQYRDNCNNLHAGSMKGKCAAEELAGEFYFILQNVKQIFDSNLSTDIKNYKGLSEENCAKLTLYYNGLLKNRDELQELTIKTAYGIFFQGIHFTPNASAKTERVWLTSLIEKKLENTVFEIDEKQRFSDILYSLDTSLSDITALHYKPFQGHNSDMGCYYRHLYQIVTSISTLPPDEFSEQDKYAYAKLLRSHLSDYEQFLLYYNALSDFGEVWNKPINSEQSGAPMNMGLIARYRLVKNLPSNVYWRLLCPIDKYKNEINVWKKMGADFFETSQFLTVNYG